VRIASESGGLLIAWSEMGFQYGHEGTARAPFFYMRHSFVQGHPSIGVQPCNRDCGGTVESCIAVQINVLSGAKQILQGLKSNAEPRGHIVRTTVAYRCPHQLDPMLPADVSQLDYVDPVNPQILVILKVVDRGYVELFLEPFNIADAGILAYE